MTLALLVRNGGAITLFMSIYGPSESDQNQIRSDQTVETSMADSLYNIQLVQKFCREALPFNVCHLTIEDMVYLHESIRYPLLISQKWTDI